MSKIIQQQDSRRIFISILIELAEKDDKIVLIVPDVGFNYIEKFQEKFPGRYFNFGVTEQSCIIIAAALALAGFKPYVYSMINFILFKPYEMVRNGIVQHNANVKLIGVSGSEKYKFLGFSHNLIHQDEDAIACKNLHLDCYSTDTIFETTSKEILIKNVIKNSYENKRPAYIRL